MFHTHFAEHSLWALFFTLCFLLASIILFIREKHLAALFTLAAAAFGMRIFMAGLDPFVHLWDERYHALVAKNMMHHPLKPTLFDKTILPHDYKQWIGSHIWLHKQPLALWQMALAYSIFGVSVFSTCIPSVFLGTLLLFLIYSIARKCFDVHVAWFAALLYGFGFYTLKFVNGSEAVDHVDLAFCFYVTASFWAWINFNNTNSKNWRIAIGVFAGLAVLTKWVTGLLVFAAWGIVVLMDPEQRKSIQAYLKIFYTFLICLVIFLPWQIYCAIRFPDEFSWEMAYNRRHLFEAIEGHSGGFWFYIERLDENFGWLAPFVIMPALYFFVRKSKNLSATRFLLAATVVCYLFFSIAKTKMNAYCHPVSAVIFIALAVFINEVYTYLKNNALHIRAGKIMLALLLCFFTFKLLEIHKIEEDYTAKNSNNFYRQNMVRYAEFYRNLDKTLPDNYVLFGVPGGSEIEAMFYTGNIVYGFWPDDATLKKLLSEKHAVAVIRSDKMPEFLQQYKEVKKIDFKP